MSGFTNTHKTYFTTTSKWCLVDKWSMVLLLYSFIITLALVKGKSTKKQSLYIKISENGLENRKTSPKSKEIDSLQINSQYKKIIHVMIKC